MPLDINQLCAKYADQLETCGNCQNGKQYIISICELDPTFDGMCGEFVEWIIQNILSDANFYDNYCSDGEIVGILEELKDAGKVPNFASNGNVKKLEEMLTESKQDIDNFKNKFGDEAFDRFIKLKDRLKNNKIQQDYTWHTKHTSPEDMEKILYNMENRVETDETGINPILHRELVGSNAYWDVYEVLDWPTAMAMGDGTVWCITGRYKTGGVVKPSQAKQFFTQYLDENYDCYLFVVNKKGKAQWCLGKLKNSTKWDIWDKTDNRDNYSFPYVEEDPCELIEMLPSVVSHGIHGFVDVFEWEEGGLGSKILQKISCKRWNDICPYMQA